MPAPRSPDKPDPVPLKVGRRALATAYARRPPTARKPHWAWRMSTVHPTTGARVLVSLGRLAPGGVEDALLAAYRALDPSAVRADGGGLRTLEPLLRAWLYDMEQRAPGGSRHGGDPIAARTLLNATGGTRRLVEAGGGLGLRGLRTADLLQVRDALAARYAPRTVRLDIKLLRQAMRWGTLRDVPIAEVDWSAVKVAVKERAWRNNHATPSHSEVARVLAGIRSSRLRLGVYLGWKTGARIGEICDLCWDDFARDEDGCWVWLEGKTGRRRFPLRPADLAVVEASRAPGAAGGDRMFNTHFRRNGSEGLKRACVRVGVAPFTFHGLRRLMTDTCQRVGVDVGTYAQMMGHSIEEALRVYRTPTALDVQGALERIRPGVASTGAGLRLVAGGPSRSD